MPDFSSILSPIIDLLAPLAGAAVKSFLRTTVGMALLGSVLVIGSFWYAGDGSWIRGLLAGSVVWGFCIVVWAVLAGKRAVATLALEAIASLAVGRRLLGVLFDRMLTLAKGAERLPLASAERYLTQAATDLLKAPEKGGGLGGWLRRKLLRTLTEQIRRLTLAEFRSPELSAAGVDLVRVRDSLTDRVDAVLLQYAGSALTRVTVVLLGGLVLVSMLVAVLIRQLPF